MNDIQRKILDIFLVVKKLCEDNNIRYFAIGGTCIGAIRHKGFIPWDDDLDIAIPIDDYDRFLEIAQNNLPENLKLYTCKEIKHYQYVFSKVMDINTTFIENYNMPYPDSYKGIFVDIMPISGVPSGRLRRKIFIKQLAFFRSMNVKLRFPVSTTDTIKGRLSWLMVNKLLSFLPYTYFSDRHLNLLRNYSFDKAEYIGYVWNNKIERWLFEREWFDGVDTVEFEDAEINCPKEWDKYLTCQFGDYMKEPSEEQREGHHYGIVRTDVPYEEYLKNTNRKNEMLQHMRRAGI